MEQIKAWRSMYVCLSRPAVSIGVHAMIRDDAQAAKGAWSAAAEACSGRWCQGEKRDRRRGAWQCGCSGGDTVAAVQDMSGRREEYDAFVRQWRRRRWDV